jgi:Domain of unknown function (DUF4124)
MLRSLAISSLLFTGVICVAHADVFRWVDDHGSVHYSDQWVPGSELIKTTKPRPPSSSSDTQRAEYPKQATSSTQLAQDNVKAVKQDVAKVREQQCKAAKDRYDKAIQARRIYKMPAAGGTAKDGQEPDREYLSDEEADAYRMKVRQEVQDFCGPSALKSESE